MNTYIQRYSEVDLFSVEGRIGRKLYFFFSTVIPFILFWVFASAAGIIAKLGNDTSSIAYALLGVGTISTLFLIVRLTIQRCHDFNKPSWVAAFALIPFANIIFSLIPGDNGLNSYGERPAPDSAFIKIAVTVLSVLLTAVTIFSLMYFLKLT